MTQNNHRHLEERMQINKTDTARMSPFKCGRCCSHKTYHLANDVSITADLGGSENVLLMKMPSSYEHSFSSNM